MRVLLLNGPNLNMLGQREPEIYGRDTIDDIVARMRGMGEELGVELEACQSNHEGALIDFIQQNQGSADGMIINPGAFGHYSYALRDAIVASNLTSIEVHISNVHAREPFRETLVLSGVCRGVITGLGWRGYLYALEWLVAIAKEGKL
ncbi:MAG TPA: type II 3-dehydroquinate dehydratase [Dehalococcoidia bacterium]|jgi:3-dehydroquinate dehydratase-2|nr:type II 3-dehydroquinate dehydratase [Dehalococcoidia bacterium]